MPGASHSAQPLRILVNQWRLWIPHLNFTLTAPTRPVFHISAVYGTVEIFVRYV